MRGSGRCRRGLALASVIAATASGLAAFAVGSGSSAAASTIVDHFECYNAASTQTALAPKPFPHTPAKVRLKNTFAPSGFTVTPGAAQLQCNPVQETVTSAGHSSTTAVKHAASHLSCRAIHPLGIKLPAALTMKNEFGSGTLRATAVRSLCMPSWTTQSAPLKFPATNAPSNLDAYVCYATVHPKFSPAFSAASAVRLKDQFGAVGAHLGAAHTLCVPTSKTAVRAANTQPELVNPDRYTVCFAIAPAAKVVTRTVYDRNQYGIGAVKVTRSTDLCVPSARVVAPPATTTTTTAPTTTTTTPLGTPITVDSYMDATVDAPFDIVTGPDGALWFTNGDNDTIGRVTTAGTLSNFTDPSIARPDGIAAGPDGALWFTNAGNNSIGRITTSGVVTNFTHATIKGPFAIAAGSDGALWFTNFDNNTIGRISTAGVVTNYTSAGAPTGHGISFPDGIAAGPDGALWFANTGYGTIGRITTAGVVTNFSDPSISIPYRIAAGPDGAMWFSNGGNNSIGRITMAGAITNYADPTISSPQGLVSGPDGAIWFMNFGNSSLGRITAAGAITNYINPVGISSPYSIAAGPDGFLWFTNAGNDSIGRAAASA